MSHRHRRRPRWRSWYLWHRYLGGLAALWVLILALTGLPLNHSAELGLDRRGVDVAWIQRWYGVRPPPLSAWPLDEQGTGRWLAQGGERLYLDATRLPGRYPPLVGAAAVGDLLVAADPRNLYLFTADGERIETIHAGGPAAPARVRGLGTTADGRLAVDDGRRWWRADAALLRWEPLDGSPARTARASAPPADLAARIGRQATAGAITLERLLLDLHSGRLLTRAGVWIMDGAALLLLILAGSGVWLWYRGARKRRQHRRRHPASSPRGP